HVMAIEVEPLLISLGVLGSLEPQLHSAARPLLGPHRHGHQYQRLDLIRIVQAILERNASSQGETDQHQVLLLTLGPSPASQPFRISFHVGTRFTLQMPRQRRREAPRIVFELMDKRFGTSTRPGPMNENHLVHIPSLSPYLIVSGILKGLVVQSSVSVKSKR